MSAEKKPRGTDAEPMPGDAVTIRRGVIRFILREYFGVLSIALIFGGTAGRWDWSPVGCWWPCISCG